MATETLTLRNLVTFLSNEGSGDTVELAKRYGMTREAMYAVLSRLEKAGLLSSMQTTSTGFTDCADRRRRNGMGTGLPLAWQFWHMDRCEEWLAEQDPREMDREIRS